MTKKLEEEFNLPPMNQTSIENDDELFDIPEESENTEVVSVDEIHRALTNAEKIDKALSSVKGLEDHSDEMDDIAQQAVDSYQQLMNLGMNVGDREAGSIFDSASKMLTTALQARDSKITAKLRQIDLMIKKERLDRNSTGKDSDPSSGGSMDRNELLRIINSKD
jgi:hypothetical protein